VRIDKLSLAALEATLTLYRDPARALAEVPVLRMLAASEDELERRARRLAAGIGGKIVWVTARVGGGALPLLELHGPAVALDFGPAGAQRPADALRCGEPPVIGRLAEDCVLLDPRTLADDEVEPAARAVRAETR
jgi:L-seryl-tRNA(Ser) seleniumtransferase